MAEPVERDVERKDGREALDKLVEALKEALVELRSAINDLNNPIIRGIGPAPEAKPREERPPSGGVGSPEGQLGAREEIEAAWSRILGENGLKDIEGTPMKPKRALSGESGAPGTPMRHIRETQRTPPARTVVTPEIPGGATGEAIRGVMHKGILDLSRLARLMRIIYELSDKAPPNYFAGLVEILQDTGLLEEKQASALKKLIEMVSLAKDHGLTVEENLMLMTLIGRELGVSSDDLMEELVKVILSRLRGERNWESQQH